MTDTHNLGKQPVNRPPTQLGDAFAPPETPKRGAGLAGLDLTPPPATAAPAPAPAAATSPEQPATVAEAPPRGQAPTRSKTSSPRSRSRKTTAATVNTTIYLPVSLYQRLRADATSTGRTYTVQLLDALDAHHQHLSDLVQAEGERPADSLFGGRRTIYQTHTDGQAQITVRPTRADLAVIDRLAAQHAGGNRSALAVSALDAHLPPIQLPGH